MTQGKSASTYNCDTVYFWGDLIHMAHPTDVHVGKRLREARLASGMTQTELVNALGISFQKVQKYERGTNRIGASRL